MPEHKPCRCHKRWQKKLLRHISEHTSQPLVLLPLYGNNPYANVPFGNALSDPSSAIYPPQSSPPIYAETDWTPYTDKKGEHEADPKPEEVILAVFIIILCHFIYVFAAFLLSKINPF